MALSSAELLNFRACDWLVIDAAGPLLMTTRVSVLGPGSHNDSASKESLRRIFPRMISRPAGIRYGEPAGARSLSGRGHVHSATTSVPDCRGSFYCKPGAAVYWRSSRGRCSIDGRGSIFLAHRKNIHLDEILMRLDSLGVKCEVRWCEAAG